VTLKTCEPPLAEGSTHDGLRAQALQQALWEALALLPSVDLGPAPVAKSPAEVAS
jgi:hypothetical protein